jgi:2Fe-2S ferredoxin
MVHVVFVSHDGTARQVEAAAGLSLMEAAKAQDISGIDAVCGGNAYCGTCRVLVPAGWLAKLPPAEDFEQDMIDSVGSLDDGIGMSATRLACQIVLGDHLAGLVVHTPIEQC